MSIVILFIVVILIASISGAFAGAVAGRWVTRRFAPCVAPAQRVGDPDLDTRIDAAARKWATQRGVPGAWRLVAKNLRLGVRLREQRRHF